MNENIKKAIENKFRGKIFNKENLPRSIKSLVSQMSTSTEEKEMFKEMDEAAKYVTELRGGFEGTKTEYAGILDSDNYLNYNPEAIKIVKNTIANDKFYDSAGNLSFAKGSELGPKKDKYLGKIRSQLLDDINIQKQQKLYDKRKAGMTTGETIARSFFPNAYDREGLIGKTAQGAVDIIEGGLRPFVAAKRSLFDNVDMAASLTAPDELRTEEEKAIYGVGASPSLVTAPVKLGAKATARLASKFGSKKVTDWMASKTPEVASKINAYLQKGADAIDTPYALKSLEDIEKAAVTAKATYGNKATAALVREGGNEAIATGAYTTSELSKEDGDLLTAGLHLLGGSMATVAPALLKAKGTGYGRLAGEVAESVSSKDLPTGFSKNFFDQLVKDAKKGNVPLTAEAVAEMVEKKLIPALKSSKEADWDLADFILVVGSDMADGSTPGEIMDAVGARIKTALSKSSEEGGVAGGYSKLDNVLQQYHEAIRGSKEGISRDIEVSNRPQTPDLKSAYDDLGESVEAKEVVRYADTQGFGMGGSVDKKIQAEPNNYVEAEGYNVERPDMLIKEEKMNREGLGGEKDLTTPILPHVKSAQKDATNKAFEAKEARKAGLSTNELSEDQYRRLGSEIGTGIEDEIRSKLGEEALTMYKAVHKGYSAMKGLDLENLVDKRGKFDRAKFSTMYNKLGVELNDAGKVNVISDTFKEFGKDTDEVIKILKSNNMPSKSYEEGKKLSEYTIKQMKGLQKELNNVTDAIQKQKLLLKMQKIGEFNKNLRHNIYADIINLATKPIKTGKGILKKIVGNSAKNTIRESPKGDLGSSFSQMGDIDKKDSGFNLDSYKNKQYKPFANKSEVKLKAKGPNVDLDSLTKTMKSGAKKAHSIISSFVGDYTPIVTSAKDSKHMKGSKHYSGEGVDFRTKDMFTKLTSGERAKKLKSLSNKLKKQMGDTYDVVLEGVGTANEHFHIEHDPK